MLRMTLAIGMILTTCLVGADEKKKQPDGVKLEAPKGWFGERIKLPPGFAKDMTFEGTEDIKFAPGMFKPNSDDFFSYVFVFELSAESKLDAKSLNAEFLKYYRGLCKAVSKGNQRDVDTSDFTAKLEKIKAEATEGLPKGMQHFHGDIKWIEPFRTNKAQTLHVELQAWKTDEFNYLFVSVSPSDKKAKIWKSMEEIRSKFHEAMRGKK